MLCCRRRGRVRRNGRGSKRSDEFWRRRGAFARRPSGRPSTARTSLTGSAAACPPSPAKVRPPRLVRSPYERTFWAHHRCSTVHSQASAHTPSRSACPTALVSPAGSACPTRSEYARLVTVLYLVLLVIYLIFRLAWPQSIYDFVDVNEPAGLELGSYHLVRSPTNNNISFIN
jgi:hypothetical protein